MVKIGLTGNRYSGKDRVAKLFKQMHVPVFEADIVLKFMLGHDLDIKEKVRGALGARAYDENEMFRPSAIKSDADFNALVSAVEFEIKNAYDRFRTENRRSIYTVFSSSILFEAGWNVFMDKSVCVFCPKKERMSRAKLSTGVSINKLKRMLDQEMDEMTKNGLADYVVHNYESRHFPDTISEVEEIDSDIVENIIKSKKTEKI